MRRLSVHEKLRTHEQLGTINRGKRKTQKRKTVGWKISACAGSKPAINETVKNVKEIIHIKRGLSTANQGL
jgi:hypothetical protein